MGLTDAVTAQGMATRHRRSVKAVQNGFGEVNALLAKAIKGNKIKWKGYGTKYEWYVRKLTETSSWTTGQLGSRTFEEKDPMDKAEQSYCFIDETYGISEKSIKTNRAAGSEKLYDIQKESARNAQNALYRSIVDAIYSNGVDDPLEPEGLMAAVADCYASTNTVNHLTGKTYAGIPLTVTIGATAAFNSARSTWATYWDKQYWYPVTLDCNESPVESTVPAWSTDAVKNLMWMQHFMTRTADVSGTGAPIKPDMALMPTGPWGKLLAILATSQTTYNIPLGTTAPELANFPTVRVADMDCIYDENVPLDSGSLNRVLVIDSGEFVIETCNTKSEGLVEGEWKQKDPEVVGGVGVYKANMGIRISTPCAIGCFVGCDD
jgi:hypothetical protein